MFRPPVCPDTKYIDKDTGEIKYAEILACPCGHYLKYIEIVRDHWMLGHFDIPQYITYKIE